MVGHLKLKGMQGYLWQKLSLNPPTYFEKETHFQPKNIVNMHGQCVSSKFTVNLWMSPFFVIDLSDIYLAFTIIKKYLFQ